MVEYTSIPTNEPTNIFAIVNGPLIFVICSYLSNILFISCFDKSFLLSMYSFARYFAFVMASISKNPLTASFIVASSNSINVGSAIFVIMPVIVRIVIVNQYRIVILENMKLNSKSLLSCTECKHSCAMV